MELIDVLKKITQGQLESTSPTDLVIGTVSSTQPLSVIVQDSQLILPAQVLKLTTAVVEKKIPILAHTHTTSGLSHSHPDDSGATGQGLSGSYGSSPALEGIACLENGNPLPVQDGYIVLNRGLQLGDKVLLLRVMGGQNFILLSRVILAGS